MHVTIQFTPHKVKTPDLYHNFSFNFIQVVKIPYRFKYISVSDDKMYRKVLINFNDKYNFIIFIKNF